MRVAEAEFVLMKTDLLPRPNLYEMGSRPAFGAGTDCVLPILQPQVKARLLPIMLWL